MDGSCDQHPIHELRRAAFAVVKMGEAEHEESVLMGTVPSILPQTAQAAEYCAAACASQVLQNESVMYGDCENVMRSWHEDRETCTQARRMYGGLTGECKR